MPSPEVVVLRLVTPQERCETIFLTDSGETLVPARQNLMDIPLVPGVPNELVSGGIESIVEGHGELGHTETGPEMASDFRDDVDMPISNCTDQLVQFASRQLTDVFGALNSIEKGHRINS